MEQCEACGKEIPRTEELNVNGFIRLYHVCPRCKTRIERDVAERDFFEEMRKKMRYDEPIHIFMHE